MPTSSLPFSRGATLGLAATLVLVAGCHSKRTPVAHDSSVTVRWTKDPVSLAPFGGSGQPAMDALTLLSGSLLQPDVASRTMRPYLAQSLPQVSARGDSLSVLTFELRPEARWDNGAAVLGADVAFTLKLLYNPALPAERERAGLSFIKEVELDPQHPRRVRVVCWGSSPAFPIALGDLPIVAEDGLDKAHALRGFSLGQLRAPSAGAQAAQTVVGERYKALEVARKPGNLPGSGPYKLVQWERDRYLQFQRRANWWGDGLRGQELFFTANPVNLFYRIMPEDNTALLSLRRGEIDVFPNVPAGIFTGLQKSSGAERLHFERTLTHDVLYLGFNTGHAALADAATRRALSRLLDTPSLARVNEGEPTVGVISPAERGRYNDSLKIPAFNPEEAGAGLKKAGWRRKVDGWYRQGQPLTIRLRYRSGDKAQELVGLQFASTARKLGVGVSLLPSEAQVLREQLEAGDFDSFLLVLRGNPFRFDFTPIFGMAGRVERGGNYTRFSDPTTERVMGQLAMVVDSSQERRLLRRFQVLMQQQMPVVPIFFLQNRVAADRRLEDLHVNTLKPGYQVTASWWSQPGKQSPALAQKGGGGKNGAAK